MRIEEEKNGKTSRFDSRNTSSHDKEDVAERRFILGLVIRLNSSIIAIGINDENEEGRTGVE